MDTSDFPRDLIEFEERFATEASCLAYVRSKKWPEGFRCSKCGGRESWWPVPGRRVDECRGCGHQESVTAGTMFHRTVHMFRIGQVPEHVEAALDRGPCEIEVVHSCARCG